MVDGESAIAVAFRTNNFNIVDDLRSAGADTSQVDPDELDKWQMMFVVAASVVFSDVSVASSCFPHARARSCTLAHARARSRTLTHAHARLRTLTHAHGLIAILSQILVVYRKITRLNSSKM